MRSIDIANTMVVRHGRNLDLSNLKLNKLVYFAYVEHLRDTGERLFEDPIKAWRYGPVEPAVYRAFKDFGRDRVDTVGEVAVPGPSVCSLIDRVAEEYGVLAAFDLVSLSHREGGAWRIAWNRGPGSRITDADILGSADLGGLSTYGVTAMERIDSVIASIPNTLKVLENS